MTTAQKERPILFSGPMVRAILDGKKTQTRRVVKLNQAYLDIHCSKGAADWKANRDALAGGTLDAPLRCTYGAPGDRLWVRETWYPCFRRTDTNTGCVYRADDGVLGAQTPGWSPNGRGGGWRPSIHMPRWASRLTLEVVSVRVERVQDISEADARSEGAELNALHGDEAEWTPEWGFRTHCVHYPNGCECFPHPDARSWFAALWDSINGKTHPWASNPWVWVVEFRRVP